MLLKKKNCSIFRDSKSEIVFVIHFNIHEISTPFNFLYKIAIEIWHKFKNSDYNSVIHSLICRSNVPVHILVKTTTNKKRYHILPMNINASTTCIGN